MESRGIVDASGCGDAGGKPSPSISLAPIVLGVVWLAIGLGLTWFSYSQRVVEVNEAGLRVIRNEQGMLAGYCAMGFGALCLGLALAKGLRAARRSPG